MGHARIAGVIAAVLLSACSATPASAPAKSVAVTATTAPNIHVANPYGLTLDAQERVIVADGQGKRVVRLDPKTGIGTGLASALVFPIHVAFDSTGGMYLADVDGYQVKKIGPSGELTPVLGTGTEGRGGAVGAPTAIDIASVYAIAFDAKDDMVFIEAGLVRKLALATGTLTTIALGLNEPHGLTIDNDGSYLISETTAHRIVRVDPATGSITTVAGVKDQAGFAGDGGSATAAQLNRPRQLSLDKSGALYVADEGNGRVRKIANGTITTVAGNGSTTLAGDGGPALAAGMRGVWGVAVNSAGDLYIASPPAAAVRKVDAKTGIITTLGQP